MGSNKEAAKLVGQLVAKRAAEKGIKSVVLIEVDIFITEEFKNLPKVQEK